MFYKVQESLYIAVAPSHKRVPKRGTFELECSSQLAPQSTDKGWPGRGPRQGLFHRHPAWLHSGMTVKCGAASVYRQEEEGEQKCEKGKGE